MSPEGTPRNTVTLALNEVLVVPDYQIRKATDPATVARYVGVIRAGGVLPHLTVGNIGGALVLLDGFHRAAAYRAQGVPTVEAAVIPTTAKEARWIAAQANMAHGLPLKRKEQREAFKAFVRAGQLKDHRGRLLSLRGVAEKFGLGGHTTILRWIQKDFPRVAREYSGERAGGGKLDQRAHGPDFHATAVQGIAQAVAAARGVTCRLQRGALVDALRRATAEVEQAAPWELNEDF